MNAKQRAAEAAIGFVKSGMTLGLGTGSTALFFIEALGRVVKDGTVRDVRCVPTSVASEKLARQSGLDVVELGSGVGIDVTVDGADEVGPGLDLIKGLGGALLREKVVAQNSRQLIIIADSSKRVEKLGTRSALPVEVARYGHEVHVSFFKAMGAEPTLRRDAAGKVFVTDNGNYIYDCRFAGGIDDPRALDERFGQRAGIVETGLFLGLATVAIVADDQKAEILRR